MDEAMREMLEGWCSDALEAMRDTINGDENAEASGYAVADPYDITYTVRIDDPEGWALCAVHVKVSTGGPGLWIDLSPDGTAKARGYLRGCQAEVEGLGFGAAFDHFAQGAPWPADR